MKKIFILGIVILVYLILEYININDNLISYIPYLYYNIGKFQVFIFIIASLFALIVISSIVFIRNLLLFSIFLFFVIITFILNSTYSNINGSGISYNDLVIILNETDKFGLDAIQTFMKAIFTPIISMIFFFIFIIFIRKYIKKENLFFSNRNIIIFLFITFSFTYTITHKTATASNKFPSLFRILDNIVFFEITSPYYGPRNKLTIYPKDKAQYKNIIFIVDESVGGKYLSINEYKIHTTPFLESYKYLINLGIVSSTTNCSASSNIILQSGIQLDNLPDKIYISLKKPNIFQYAKNAGFTTSYISNQSFKDKLQNYMTKFDLKYIDYFFQPYKHIARDDEKIPEEEIIKKTQQQLLNNKKNFIYIVKAGVHFHYENTYPSSQKFFKPTLKYGEAISFDKKNKMLNSYYNAIKWKVDEFFKYFLKNIPFDEKTIIIYTSDHGQSILENIILNTHCKAKNPPKSQGIVPLIIFVKNKNILKHKIIKNKNQLSSFAIFPTIIKLMGYETKDKTFFDNFSKKDQLFFSGNLFGITNNQKTNINK